MFHDLRIGCRSLLRSPLFTLTAAGSLALGIAACTVIFSVVYTLLLRPLPYPHPSELVTLGLADPSAGEKADVAGLPPAVLKKLRDDPHGEFSALGGFNYDYVNLTHVPTPTQLLVGQTTRDYFRVFGVPARLGRTFQDADCRLASPPTVVLSDALWRTQFHAAPGIVGQPITLADQSYTVVGVMPPGFKDAAGNCDLWTPLAEDGPEMSETSVRTLISVGRFPGGEREIRALRAELATISANLAQADPVRFGHSRLATAPLRTTLVEDGTTHALWLLLGAVGCLLLVTCANVANLQLVRAGARRREVGVRLALGASRARILRLCLAESFVLAAVGCGLGVLAASWGVDAVVTLLPPGSSPFQDEIRLSLPVLWFALVVAALTGVVTGLLPAWLAARQDPAGSLAAGGRGASEGPGGARVRATLVVAEIALALVLLAGAGLMGRSLLATLRTPAGLRTERTLMLNLSVPESRYARGPERTAYFQRLLAGIGAVPGVVGVGLSTTEPFNWSIPMKFLLPGQTEGAPETARQTAAYDAVNPAFFSTLDIPILRGRAFDAHDNESAPPAVVVNDAFARRYFPRGDALGGRLTLPGAKVPNVLEIVGISGDVRRNGLDKEAPPQMYLSYLQRPQFYATLYVRAAGELGAESLTRGVEAAIWQVDADQPIGKVSTLARAVSGSVASARLYVVLFGGFAVMALLLAALGIYGTVSYSVGQRTRELGIRLALGAQRRDVLRLVLGQGARLILLGLALGLGVSLALSRLLASLLFGVAPNDPATLAFVAVLLGAVALLASYLPARGAGRIDPLTALREE